VRCIRIRRGTKHQSAARPWAAGTVPGGDLGPHFGIDGCAVINLAEAVAATADAAAEPHYGHSAAIHLSVTWRSRADISTELMHDAYRRMLKRLPPDSKTLWQEVDPPFERGLLEAAFLIWGSEMI
jgi:hypothetical protein